MPRLMNPMPAKGKNFIVLIGVAVVLLTALGVGIFFLVKQLNKKTDGGSDKKALSWKRGLNNGGVGCNQFCTNTGGTWGDTYARAEKAIIVGPGGVSGLTSKTYKIGDEIDVNEVPGAFYPDGDSTKTAYFGLDCGCSN